MLEPYTDADIDEVNGSLQCPDTGHPVRYRLTPERRLVFEIIDDTNTDYPDYVYWRGETENWVAYANAKLHHRPVLDWIQLVEAAEFVGVNKYDL